MCRFKSQSTVFALSALAASALFTTPKAAAAINVGSSAWTWQDPRPQGNRLNAVSCPSASTCFAVGDIGTILQGSSAISLSPTFTQAPPVTSQELLGVSCASTTSCLAVGANGTVVAYGLEDFFCNPITHICTALYGWVLEPNSRTGIPSNVQLNAVSCPSTSICLAVGAQHIFVTQNGGSTWSTIFTGSSSSDFLTGISCTATTLCWAVGPQINGAQIGTVLEVFNSSGWKTVPWNSSDSIGLTAISCSSTRDCVAVDGFGNSVHTTNAPLDWSLSTVSFKKPLFAISCVPDTQSCAAVGLANTNGSNAMFLSIDNGASWVEAGVNYGGVYVGDLYGVSCTNFGGQCAGLTVGVAGVMAENPSSGIPYDVQSYYTTDNPTFFTRVSCPAEGICFALGGKGTILTTSNHGTSWTQQASGTSQTLNAITCPGTSVCYAVGAGGTILRSTGTWSTQNSRTTQNLTAISCSSLNVCLAGGPASSNSSKLFFTNNGGSSWIPATTLTGTNLQLSGMSCAGTGPTTCDLVFLNGQILQTTTQSNGSTSAPVILANTPAQLNDISCPTLTLCTAVGGQGLIFSNQSRVWQRQTSGTTNDLSGVSCLPLSSGTQCVAVAFGPVPEILFGTGATWTTSAPVDEELFGVSCAGNAIGSPQAYQCIAVGGNATILSLLVGSTGVGTLVPSHGSSEVEDPTTF